ncbi:MAG: exosortase C-terminal domain/associated protein EpsI [Pseudomonadota bacterium]
MPGKKFYVSLAAILACFLGLHLLHRNPVVVVATNLERLPPALAGFQGHDNPFETAVMEELAPDASLSRSLVPPSGSRLAPMFLYVGYYGTAKGGRTAHNPYACYPAAGWSIVSDGRVEVYYQGQDEPASVNEIVIKRGLESQVVLFWYQSRCNHIVHSGFQQNLNRFFSRLLHGRDDGAFVRLSADAGEDVGRARRQLASFAERLIPQLAAHWPEEREVKGQ